MKATSVSHRQLSDAPELQEVLTRYIDSRDGYQQAAELVDHRALAEELRTISRRRSVIIETIKDAIAEQGQKVDQEGSTEAKDRRWNLEFQSGVSRDDVSPIISECIRSERELDRALAHACKDSETLPSHLPMLEAARSDVLSSICGLEAIVEAF
ncbi:DUF2383 domain-containing protein [Haloferula chungangensis]|uniref:DUF2383 domain-containing protein n=1 Tax=Haloferula chungangensis TaxID=1048331 RepID=A0ABW2L4R7_9BACT